MMVSLLLFWSIQIPFLVPREMFIKHTIVPYEIYDNVEAIEEVPVGDAKSNQDWMKRHRGRGAERI